jgi:hypothetical protein
MRTLSNTTLALSLVLLAVGCGDDDGNAADRLGVGAQCDSDDDCLQAHHDGGISASCLPQFKGGYCGVEDCSAHDDCPEGSACVAHTDGNNYCFRICADKPECNLHRDDDNESNCSSNIDYVEGDKAEIGKACVPPSA